MSIRRLCGMTLVVLGLLAVGCHDSTGQLLTQLKDGDHLVRRRAARALADEHGGRADVAAALTLAMQDSDLEVCELAGSALGAMGSAAASSLPALEKVLNDDEPSVRISAALAIQKIDPARRSYVPEITQALTAGHGPVFLEVGAMGSAAEWAVPTLIKLLSDRRAPIRALAAQTLGQIGSGAKEAEAALQRRLRDDSPVVRDAARRALENIQAPPVGESS